MSSNFYFPPKCITFLQSFSQTFSFLAWPGGCYPDDPSLLCYNRFESCSERPASFYSAISLLAWNEPIQFLLSTCDAKPLSSKKTANFEKNHLVTSFPYMLSLITNTASSLIYNYSHTFLLTLNEYKALQEKVALKEFFPRCSWENQEIQVHAGCKAKLKSVSEDRLSCLQVAVGRVAWKLSCGLILGCTCQHYCWRLGLLLRELRAFWMLVFRRSIYPFGYFSSVSTNKGWTWSSLSEPGRFNTSEIHLPSPVQIGPGRQILFMTLKECIWVLQKHLDFIINLAFRCQ